MPVSEVKCCDCMDYMKQFPDKYFDLAIVDPPYGGGNQNAGGFKITRTGGTWNKKYYTKGQRRTKTCEWDIPPGKEYFSELFRIAKNQIIWGGNYFALPPNRCFVIWRKLTISEKFTMAMCEYAWTSFEDNAKWIELAPQDGNRFHPTQKPIALYIWLLENYAKPGDKILDTHMGSQSSRIAAWKMGFDYWGCEIDQEYFDQGCARFEKEKRQLSLFAQPEEPGQEALF